MRRTVLSVAVVLLAGCQLCTQAARAGTLRVVREIDFPEKLWLALDVAWDGQYLNVPGLVAMGDGTFGAGFLQIEPSDGSLASEFGLGGLPVRTGMTFDGTDYWTSTAFAYAFLETDVVYSHAIEKWSGSRGTRLERFGFRSSSIEPRGLAWDGTDLWLADDLNGLISRLDPDDLSVVESFAAPGTQLRGLTSSGRDIGPLTSDGPATRIRGLTWDGSAFWSIDIEKHVIYRFDSEGNVLATYSTPVRALEGIAYDGQYLWILDNDSRTIWCAVPEPSTLVLLTIGAAGIVAVARHRRQSTRATFPQINDHLR